MQDDAYLEKLWDDLLSRQANTIQSAFKSLQPSERRNVKAHLERMASEPGWHPEQRISANAALEAIKVFVG